VSGGSNEIMAFASTQTSMVRDREIAEKSESDDASHPIASCQGDRRSKCRNRLPPQGCALRDLKESLAEFVDTPSGWMHPAPPYSTSIREWWWWNAAKEQMPRLRVRVDESAEAEQWSTFGELVVEGVGRLLLAALETA
jgi:hypothetical protein